jgi:hypothetical protein
MLRCARCRLLVEIAPDPGVRACAACGGPLEKRVAVTIWDDEDPTDRRPIDYAKQRPHGLRRQA